MHMVKHSKSKPGSPTEPVSTDITHVQDNIFKPPMTEQELNKPFTLVLSVPHYKGLTAIFHCITIETGVFPVDRDNDAMHAFIVDKITNITCDAMKTHFTMKSEIQDGICCLVKGNYKRNATGKIYFWFLTSQRPSNNNVAITFAATCHQCLRSDSPSGHFIWVYLPDGFINHLLDLVCFALEDHPNNKFFDKAYPFLPTDIRGAFQLCKQSSIVEKRPFSNALCQGLADKWHIAITIFLLNDPANFVTIQDSDSHEPLDASQVPYRVSMDSNQGAKDSSQDSKCTELDSHACQLSPMANWGHIGVGPLNSTQPDPNSTLTMGNTLQSIHFSNGTEENFSCPSDTTVGNDPSFPSVINDISSI